MVRVDLTIHREPLTDEDVELCFSAMQQGVQELAKRHMGRICSTLNALISKARFLRGTGWEVSKRSIHKVPWRIGMVRLGFLLGSSVQIPSLK